MEIERFKLTVSPYRATDPVYAVPYRHPEGPFVRYSDHKAQLEQERRAALEITERLTAEISKLVEERDRAEAQLEQAIAEFAERLAGEEAVEAMARWEWERDRLGDVAAGVHRRGDYAKTWAEAPEHSREEQREESREYLEAALNACRTLATEGRE